MKRKILYLTISISLLCCTSAQDDALLLFNAISFHVNDNEDIIKIDLEKNDHFNSFFDTNSVQIPLYRCIKSKNHLIFIGIPFNTSVEELANYELTSDWEPTSFESDSTTYFYKKYTNGKEHITIYTKNYGNNLVYVLTTSNSAVVTDSLFNPTALSNRFKK
jgi:hypothetical protein